MKDILKTYMKASLPWIDAPTDMAIKSVLYYTAVREGIKYILDGADFRSEGKQPTEWTYGDAKQLLCLQKKFGDQKIKTFPYTTITRLFYYGFIKKIKKVHPFYYLDYQKKEAQRLLIKEYDWEYYGGHHHENIFTRFAIAYWLPKKFNIDKRIITLSAQVLSGEITRQDASEELKNPPYNTDAMERDKDYIVKKLGLTSKNFEEIWNSTNKFFWNYPSYYPTIKKYMRFIKPILKYILHREPMMFAEMEMRNQEN